MNNRDEGIEMLQVPMLQRDGALAHATPVVEEAADAPAVTNGVDELQPVMGAIIESDNSRKCCSPVVANFSLATLEGGACVAGVLTNSYLAWTPFVMITISHAFACMLRADIMCGKKETHGHVMQNEQAPVEGIVAPPPQPPYPTGGHYTTQAVQLSPPAGAFAARVTNVPVNPLPMR